MSKTVPIGQMAEEISDMLQEDADLAAVWNDASNSFEVDFHVLDTCAMADVDGELEHHESVALQTLAELGIPFAVFLGFSG